MSAKPESKEPAVDKAAAPEKVPAKASSGAASWIPAIGAILLSPVVCFALAQFVLIPRFQKKLGSLATTASAEPAPAPIAAPAPAAKGDEKGGASNTYDFTNVVVNLSGTMGTRYLKTSFSITGNDPTLRASFEAGKARLTDVTLSVLSALSLSELEEPGAKNVLRDRLVAAYNEALGHHAVEQVYFSDFIVQ